MSEPQDLASPACVDFWSTQLSVLIWTNVNEKPFNFPIDTPNNMKEYPKGKHCLATHMAQHLLNTSSNTQSEYRMHFLGQMSESLGDKTGNRGHRVT